MPNQNLRLVGDIGGTNARFGVAQRGIHAPVSQIKHIRVADFPTAQAGIAQYLNGLPADARPTDAVLAVAGPIMGGKVDLTNAKGWHLDETTLTQALDLEKVKLINDFAALSLAVSTLGASDVTQINHPGLIDASQTVTLIGPGTGTGVGAWVRDGSRAAVLVTEGGHIAFAPGDELEFEILRLLARQFGRVSVERILAGQGLVNLHQAMATIHGWQITDPITPAAITDGALAGDAQAQETFNRFCAILGSVAGDLALAHGARGGVLLAGGILPRVVGLLEASPFRARFDAKGRFEDYMRALPTNLLTADYVALRGAAQG